MVEGTIEGLEDGTVVWLQDGQSDSSVRLATDTVHDGRFHLQATASTESPVELFSKREGKEVTIRTLWLHPGDTLRLCGKQAYASGWTAESTNPLQAEQTLYDTAVLHEALEDASLRTMMGEWAEQSKAVSELEAKRLQDSMRNTYQQIRALAVRMAEKRFVALKKRYWHDGKVDTLSPCGMQLMKQIVPQVREKGFSLGNEVKEFYLLIPQCQQNKPDMGLLSKQLFPPHAAQQGEPMYDGAILYDGQGNKHRLSDYLKGNYLLLDFWASSCGPCIHSFVELKELSDTYKGALTVISVSLDGKTQWENASRRHAISWISLNDSQGYQGIFAHYGVGAIPHYVLIAPDGKILKVFKGYSKGSIKRELSSIFPQLQTR